MGEKKFLDKEKVKAAVEAAQGKMFTVVFEKENGELRQMTCRQGVTKKLKGGEATYNSNPDNIGVYDLAAKDGEGEHGAYRCFNAGRVIEIRAGGEVVKAKDAPKDEPIHNAAGEVINKD